MLKKLMGVAAMLMMVSTTNVGAEEREDFTVMHKRASFNAVFQDLTDAIVNKGLVIDFVGHTNDMLLRTADALKDTVATGDPSPYLNAKYVIFCSSSLLHQAARANPYNMAVCPYTVFAFETREKPGRVAIGFRNPEMGITGPSRNVMEKIDKLLREVVSEATDQ